MIDDKSDVDKILIGLGIPVDMLNWYDEDSRNFEFAPIDDDTKITLKDMITVKEKALRA